MTGELPIYSESDWKGPNPFPALDGIRDGDLERVLERFDRVLDHGDGAGNVKRALQGMRAATKSELLGLHAALFEGRPAAGELRSARAEAIFRGQDCPPPEFLDRSLANFEEWLDVDSLSELHPIQRAALALTRIVDIWPFQYGNRTTAVVFANFFLSKAGLPAFFVLPDQTGEFDQILEQAVMMQTEPLVRAIYRCMERELDRAHE